MTFDNSEVIFNLICIYKENQNDSSLNRMDKQNLPSQNIKTNLHFLMNSCKCECVIRVEIL